MHFITLRTNVARELFLICRSCFHILIVKGSFLLLLFLCERTCSFFWGVSFYLFFFFLKLRHFDAAVNDATAITRSLLL